ncbi:MAG: LytTR family transcriptional regulator DNA-binding domain-containing protein [Candidatus Kapabacteria bacterium]|jgi:two-component system LytT family response regulator|nr:LytTR family transcriptional regulator DNA-binding domain-containing protein [Candidatus Kapabacteria bacterium]
MSHIIAVSIVFLHKNTTQTAELRRTVRDVCLASADTIVHWENTIDFFDHYDPQSATPTIIFLDTAALAEAAEKQAWEMLNAAYTSVIICLGAGEIARNAHVRQVHQRFGTDFLFEPFDEDAVRSVLERIRNEFADITLQRGLDSMLLERATTFFASASPPSVHALKLPTNKGDEIFITEDILYCEAQGEITFCYLLSEGKTLVSVIVFKRFAELEEMLLKHDFVRIHNSIIVNVRHCAGFEHKGKDGTLQLRHATETPLTVSRTYKKRFLKRFKPKK